MQKKIWTCECKKNNCLKDFNGIKKYIEQVRLNIFGCSDYRLKYMLDGNLVYEAQDLKNDLNLGFLRKNTCMIIKKYINLHFRTDDLNTDHIHIYNLLKEELDTNKKLLDKLVKYRDKGKSIFKSTTELFNHYKNEEFNHKKITMENKIKIKQLTKQLKFSNNLISTMTFSNKPDIIDLNDNNDSPDDSPEDSPDDSKNPHEHKKDYIQNYQIIKNYMIVNNLSITEIAHRNNIKRHILLDKFLNLKDVRNQTAHPKTKEIFNDTDFLNILNN